MRKVYDNRYNQPTFDDGQNAEEDESQICGKCHVLKGRSEEKLYADYIESMRSYLDITLEIRKS